MAQKSSRKQETVPFSTPWMTARYPKISKPDTEGQYADGKFKADGILEEDDIEGVRETLLAAAKQFFPKVPTDEVKLPLKEFFNGRKGETKTSAGWGLTFKSKYRPAVFDAKKKKLPEGAIVGAGSIFRVASQIAHYEKTETETTKNPDGTKTKETVTVYGLNLYLNDTQLKKFVADTAGGSGNAFDEVEGFEYEADEADTDSFDGDATDL